MDAEHLVADLLEQDGWQVLARRWVGDGAEVDLVVRRGAALRFVEVKLRQPDDPVGLEVIDERKVARLYRAGEAFLRGWSEPLDEACLMVALVEPRDGGGHAVTLLDDPV